MMTRSINRNLSSDWMQSFESFKPKKATIEKRVKLEASPSDIEFRGGKMYVADDQIGLLKHSRLFRKTSFKATPDLNKSFDDLEGLAYDPRNKSLWVLDETTEGEGPTLTHLQDPGKRRSADTEDARVYKLPGIPGIDEPQLTGVAMMNLADEDDTRLVLCNKSNPPALIVFDPRTGEVSEPLLVPGLSDDENVKFQEVTYDPFSGNIMLLIKKPREIVEVEIARSWSGPLAARVRGRISLKAFDDVDLEGIGYDARGRIWLGDEENNEAVRISYEGEYED